MTDNKTPKAEDAAAAAADSAVALRDRRKALAAELAALDATAAENGITLSPTHVLTLENGDRVESVGTVSTHHSTPDGVFRVIRVDPLDHAADRR